MVQKQYDQHPRRYPTPNNLNLALHTLWIRAYDELTLSISNNDVTAQPIPKQLEYMGS